MIVRRAGSNDSNSLSTFFIEVWKEAGPGALGFTGATEESITKISSEAFLKKVLTDSATPIIIAENAGKVIGFSSLRMIDRNRAELSGIVVRENFTGKGIGSHLFEKAKEVAIDAGCEKIVVKTESVNNRAISFYKKLGFWEIGIVDEVVEGSRVKLMVLERVIP